MGRERRSAGELATALILGDSKEASLTDGLLFLGLVLARVLAMLDCGVEEFDRGENDIRAKLGDVVSDAGMSFSLDACMLFRPFTCHFFPHDRTSCSSCGNGASSSSEDDDTDSRDAIILSTLLSKKEVLESPPSIFDEEGEVDSTGEGEEYFRRVANFAATVDRDTLSCFASATRLPCSASPTSLSSYDGFFTCLAMPKCCSAFLAGFCTSDNNAESSVRISDLPVTRSQRSNAEAIVQFCWFFNCVCSIWARSP
mmetsp:Transcript_48099/g.77602  ORF Transcript_48099/g.77602 Transcript_48099/m.77602 type:complete len:256 (+) Transcript_48099:224-991(+)